MSTPLLLPPSDRRRFLSWVSSVLILAAGAAVLPAAPPEPAERPHASGISLRSLDLSGNRAPEDAELVAAGQLGSPLSPGRRRVPPHAATHALGSLAHAAEEAADRRQFGEAMQLWNAHKFRQARERFIAHRAAHPGSRWAGEAELHVGCEAQFGGDWPTAKRYFDGIIAAEEPGSAIHQKAKLRRAVLHLDQGELNESSDAFADLLATEADWQRRTYAHTWLRQISLYKANEVALRDCGAQSIAYVLRARGKSAEADAAAATPAAGKRGFSVGELRNFARERGLEPAAVRAADVAQLPVPFIAHYRDRHFVAVAATSGENGKGEVRVYDPRLRREVSLSAESFAAQWSGLALVFAPVGEDVKVASAAEQAENFGGCCGHPRPEDDLGPTCPDTESSGAGAPTCSTCRGMPEWSVNLINMNLIVQDIPFWYDNPVGPKVEIHLVYNSQDALNQLQPFGNKWTFNYVSYAMESPSSSLPRGTVTLVMPGGRRDNYQPDGGQTGYIPPVGVFNTLVKTGSHAFLLSDQNGTIYSYGVPPEMGAGSTSTLLLSLTDRYGVGLTFGHDAQGRMNSITDHWNRITTLHYNAAGLVDDVSDQFGRHATFTYDASHNLTGQTDMGGVAYGYAYDANVYLTALQKPTGTTTFYVEPADRINNGLDAYPLPGAAMWENYRITITDPTGAKEEYHYNGFNTSGGLTYYRDKLQYQPVHPGNTPNTAYLCHLYNGKPKFDAITHADGTSLSLGYDGQNQVAWQQNERGYYVSNYRNAQGRLTSTRNAQNYYTEYEYAPNGLDLITVRRGTTPWQSATAVFEQRTYDAARNLLTVTDALNHATTYAYNAFGQVTSVTNALNEPPTVYAYNTRQQLVTVKRNNVTLSSLTYDNVGRVQSRTDADGLTLAYEYDALNRLTRTVHMDSTDEKKQWGCCHLDSDTDRAGKTTTYTYDTLNRLKTKTDALNQTVTYDYDAVGRLNKLTDAKNQATRWEYDARGRANKKIYADNTFETHEHDGAGNLTASTDAKGIRTQYAYDEESRLTQRSTATPPAGTAAVANASFTYDGLGRRVTMNDGNAPVGTTTYAYDAADRLTGVDGPLADDDVAFGYDALNRPTSRTVHGGVPVVTSYDGQGRVQNVTNALGSFGYTYAGATSPRLSRVDFPNAMFTTYAYYGSEKDFRLKTIQTAGPVSPNGFRVPSPNGPRPRRRLPTGTVSLDAYDYAPCGEITSWQRTAWGVADFNWSITYDAIGQMGRIDDPLTTNTTTDYDYAYDPAGNVSMWGTASSAYNLLNQLTGRSVTAPATATQGFAYDANGNLQSLQVNGAADTAYEWDAQNRLTAFVRNGHRSEFAYDGLGRRTGIVEKTLDPANGNSATVTADRRFLWVGHEIVREQETLSGVAKEFLAQGFKVTGGPAANAGSFFHVRDHLGSVREVFDAGAVRRARYGYDPYGQRTKLFGASGDVESDFGFTGHYVHAPSGLHLAMYRAYDAELGRWLNRDPKGESEGPNTYCYVNDNPILFTDQLGLAASRQECLGKLESIRTDLKELQDHYSKTHCGSVKAILDQFGPAGRCSQWANSHKDLLLAAQIIYNTVCIGKPPEPPTCPDMDPVKVPKSPWVLLPIVIGGVAFCVVCPECCMALVPAL